MVKSVSSLNVGAIGTGLRTPPSMRIASSLLTGVKNKGSETEALMASNSEPLFIQTSFSVTMSAATAVNGIDRFSI